MILFLAGFICALLMVVAYSMGICWWLTKDSE